MYLYEIANIPAGLQLNGHDANAKQPVEPVTAFRYAAGHEYGVEE